MSHLVSIKTQVRDPVAIRSACRRLQMAEPRQRTVTLFNSEVTGLAVEFPDWRYPVVCDIQTGDVKYDNFNGVWGEVSQLHRFLQAYAVEKSLLEAGKQGHSVVEQQLPDGWIRVRATCSQQ